MFLGWSSTGYGLENHSLMISVSPLFLFVIEQSLPLLLSKRPMKLTTMVMAAPRMKNRERSILRKLSKKLQRALTKRHNVFSPFIAFVLDIFVCFERTRDVTDNFCEWLL
jgi:hypothetical protein